MEAVLFVHGHRFCTKRFHKLQMYFCTTSFCGAATNFFPEQPIILCLFVDNEHMVGQFGIVWPYLVIRDYLYPFPPLRLLCHYRPPICDVILPPTTQLY